MSILQKATINGQMLDLSIDLSQLPERKKEVVKQIVGIINNSTSEQDRSLACNTLADVFMLFEKWD